MPVENPDRRRRQYVPLVSTFAHGRTAERLLAKFGRDGLLVWVCFIAACKRAPEQGVFEYTSEGDAWATLGLHGYEPEFTLKTFFTYTGRLKKTSRTYTGRVTYVVCTRWEEYALGVDRELDAARKRRKRGTKTPDIEQTEAGQRPDVNRTEGEVESEGEREVVAAKAATPKPRKPDPLWDVLEDELGKVETASERGKRNKALKELREIGATPDGLLDRIQWWRREWPDVSCTATGLVANWSVLAGTPTGSRALAGRRNGMSPADIVAYTKGRP
jgi:hypothetical protein